MPRVCRRGGILRKSVYAYNIPEIAINCVKEFLKLTGYKGSIILPHGPYDTDTYNHILRSLELIDISGAKDITKVIIGKDSLSVETRARTIVRERLTISSDLENILKSYRRKIKV